MTYRASDNLSALQILPSDPPFYLRRVRLNSQGYTSEGYYYYGSGAALYYWAITLTEGAGDTATIDECAGEFRARHRDAAKAHIQSARCAKRTTKGSQPCASFSPSSP